MYAMPDKGIGELVRDGAVLGGIGSFLTGWLKRDRMKAFAMRLVAGAILGGALGYVLKDVDLFHTEVGGWTASALILFMACGIGTEKILKKIEQAGISIFGKNGNGSGDTDKDA